MGTTETGYSYTVVRSSGGPQPHAELFLREYSSGTARTYAYVLVKHLRWLDALELEPGLVTMTDLDRYMRLFRTGALPYDRRPPSVSTINVTATCLSSFYAFLMAHGLHSGGLNPRWSTKQGISPRDVRLLGHLNPPSSPPSLLPQMSRPRRRVTPVSDVDIRALLTNVASQRDAAIIIWLRDAGLRVGELCGRHLHDLHLTDDPLCGEPVGPHIHICDREQIAPYVRVKVRVPWAVENGVIVGGSIRRVSPQMIHAYYEYQMSERTRRAAATNVFLRLDRRAADEPLAPAGVRKMLHRLSVRSGIPPVRPHQFRHRFGQAILEASQSAHVASTAGGWRSTKMIEEVYGHPDLTSGAFDAALRTVWGATDGR